MNTQYPLSIIKYCFYFFITLMAQKKDRCAMDNAAVRIIIGPGLSSEKVRQEHNDLRKESEQKDLNNQYDYIRVY